ncbi:MAG: hypothetical protein H6551_04165 [Chitinophagales bacterium]|nr:hypothetical protein [Chitinophagaceae bacterium]MCB9064318.1 hypothetical protein [Chitinophagales bacterium]
MRGIFKTSLLTPIILLLINQHGLAQQFIGLNTTKYAGIQHMATNPAWVNTCDKGTEVMLFSANVLAGTNAYSVRKKFVFEGFNGQGLPGVDYFPDEQRYQKHLWANLEINGPAFSTTYKDVHHVGMFTRVRQLYRAGNITSSEFLLIGNKVPEIYNGQNVDFKKAGFTTHTFAEVGFTYGQTIRDDNYHIARVGVSLKYLMGFVAGSIYTESLQYQQKSADSIGYIKGDLTILYTHNMNSFIDANVQNDITGWFQRAGRWGLGLDIGGQYEYHPDGNPNKETPYLFSIAASITDIGSIGYVADTGSGTYELNIANIDTAQFLKRYEDIDQYLIRLQQDTAINAHNGDIAQKFRVGLPTAFRLNIDYNATDKLNFAVNILLNMRGSRKLYKPAYVSYFNFTPSYGGKNFKVGLPFSVIGYQTFAIGTVLQVGPFYMGSTSVLSMLMSSRLRNIDGYVGFAYKFIDKKKQFGYYK